MNLLRIHSISILTLLAICALSNGSPIDNTKDSRIVRINPQPDEKQPRLLHDDIRGHAPNPFKPSGKKSYLSNRQLLTKLGLSKLRIPASHSRKRLAVESRHHARPDDSHMFVIKLPPNPYYYTNPNPAAAEVAATVANKNSNNPYPYPAKTAHSSHPKNSIHDNDVVIGGSGSNVGNSADIGGNKPKKISSAFGFQLNGKPGRIYHWNIPVLKKMFYGDKGRSSMPKNDMDVADIIDIKNTPTWSKPWENDTADKSYNKFGVDETKSLKRKYPSYYAPVKSKKNTIHNYFPGNGKPRGFYVIQHNKRSSRKPMKYYRKLIY